MANTHLILGSEFLYYIFLVKSFLTDIFNSYQEGIRWVPWAVCVRRSRAGADSGPDRSARRTAASRAGLTSASTQDGPGDPVARMMPESKF